MENSKDAETIVDFALDEPGSIDQLELLRLKAILQVSQQKPKQAVETYRTLLAVIQAKKELWLQANFDQVEAFRHEALTERKLEMEAWQDLATIYADLSSSLDAKAYVDKAKLIEFFSLRSWHFTVTSNCKKLFNECFEVTTYNQQTMTHGSILDWFQKWKVPYNKLQISFKLHIS